MGSDHICMWARCYVRHVACSHNVCVCPAAGPTAITQVVAVDEDGTMLPFQVLSRRKRLDVKKDEALPVAASFVFEASTIAAHARAVLSWLCCPTGVNMHTLQPLSWCRAC